MLHNFYVLVRINILCLYYGLFGMSPFCFLQSGDLVATFFQKYRCVFNSES